MLTVGFGHSLFFEARNTELNYFTYIHMFIVFSFIMKIICARWSKESDVIFIMMYLLGLHVACLVAFNTQITFFIQWSAHFEVKIK